MAVKTADFELGTIGQLVKTTDAGSLNAWDDAPGNYTYDNTHVAHGSQSAKQTAIQELAWSITPVTEQWARFYLYATTNPATGFPMMWGSTSEPRISMNTSGKILIDDAPGSGELTTTTSIGLNQWIRIEFHIVHSATVGQFVLSLYNSADSITPIETLTSPATWNTNANSSTFTRFGNRASNAWGTNIWWDSIAWSTVGAVGPFPICTQIPRIRGTLAVGSVVTCDGGIWNSGITNGYYQGIQYQSIGYQWVRDGVDIAAATSQTYTLVTADSPHMIQCRVTNTGIQATSETASALSAGVPVGSTPSIDQANYFQ